MKNIDAVVAGLVLLGCAESTAGSNGGGQLPQQAQDASDPDDATAFERWKQREPDQYVVQTCTMGIEPPGCVRALVEDGEVISIAERIYAERDLGWEDFTAEHGGAESPLDSMFTRVEAGDDEECTVEDVEYDAELRYVDSYALRCDGSVQGGHWVACFEANTSDPERCDVVP